MRLGIVGDVHWSQYSSILRHRGNDFSVRLENCIQSINWVEQLTANCEEVFYLGDFFDKAELNSEEITALGKIKWNEKPHTFLVGNHEMGINNLSFSSSHIFNMCNANVIDTPTIRRYDKFDLCFLPYILEADRQPIINYLRDMNTANMRIILSHNDIAGIQLGSFISKNGFSIDEIEDNCDLFINGHLHNGGKVTDKIINIGNLTGQNFSEDAFKYDHTIFILDTDTLKIEVWENPYAINFYKLEKLDDLAKVRNAVVTLKIADNHVQAAKEQLENNPEILAHRLISVSDKNIVDNNVEISFDINHIDKFREFALQELGNSDIVLEELGEVLNG